MRTRFIRNADRTPVACVVSTGTGRVGWSVYHPHDIVEVPRRRYVYNRGTGKVAVVDVLDTSGKPVMQQMHTTFCKKTAVQVAAEREFTDPERAIQAMDAVVPEERTYSSEKMKRCHLVDDKGNRVDDEYTYKLVKEDLNLKDELARLIYQMHDRSLG